jgi:hypothetical protein
MSKHSPLPRYSTELGRDSNGSTKHFILVEGGCFKHSPGFLAWGGVLVRFDTKTDAALFCQLANDGFIDFPFLIPTKSKPTPNNDN